jgi:hypothetical protein
MKTTIPRVILRGYLLFACILLISSATVNAQVPANSYDDKGGDASKLFNFHPINPFAYLGTSSFLKIYKNRDCGKVETAKRLKQTTTLVVIDDENSAYGQALKKAFADHWKYTAFKIIKPAEVFTYYRKTGYSFFMFARDEHKEGRGVNDKGQMTATHGDPNIYYKCDTMVHAPKFFGTEYISTYMFVLTLRCGVMPEDTDEEHLTEAWSYADYTLPNIDNDFRYGNAGKREEKETLTIPQLGAVVGNIERDLEYMYKNNREKMPTPQTLKYSMPYKGNTLKFTMDIVTYEGGQDTWANKTLLINNKLCDDFGKSAIAGLLGLDDSKARLVSPDELDKYRKLKDNTVMMLDMERDENGNYQVTTADSTELIGMDREGMDEIVNKKRAGQAGDYQSGKCDISYNDKEYTFKFNYVAFGGKSKQILKNRTIYINSDAVDEFGKKIITRVMDLDSGRVKFVPLYSIDSIVHRGNNDCLIFTGRSMDESYNYMITTTDGVEIIGIHSTGYNKEVGELDLIGADKWSERKKMSLK